MDGTMMAIPVIIVIFTALYVLLTSERVIFGAQPRTPRPAVHRLRMLMVGIALSLHLLSDLG